jgi:5'-methylthioadenosine phosphorylase
VAVKIGVIGGSGSENSLGAIDFVEKNVETPYGKPSSPLAIGKIGGVETVFLARHGKTHTLSPSNVNYAANVSALKQEGCTHVIAVTACGSLKDEIKPGDFVFPDQFIDFTKLRKTTLFEKPVHTAMDKPFCKPLTEILVKTAGKLSLPSHAGKTILTIEGPRFSTKAESKMYRMLGADVVNMTTVPEVVFVRELKMHYATIAMITDYDCWRDSEEPVSFEMVLKQMEKNALSLEKLLNAAIPEIRDYDCGYRVE